MAYSMTGYGRVQSGDDELSLVLTLRSVNHRFLDLQLRIPSGLEPLEPLIRKRVKGKLKRGQIQISASLRWTRATAALRVNRPFVDGYLNAYRQLAADYELPNEPDLNVVLRMPPAVSFDDSDLDEEQRGRIEAVLDECLARVLDELLEVRRREGEGIVNDIKGRARLIGERAKELESVLGGVIPAFQQRLEQRLSELLSQTEIEPQRLLQEAAVLADRSDVSEELQRLSAHAERLRELLEQDGELGKRIDFLAQEMNREANTLLSKTTPLGGAGLGVTETGLELKAEIEKIREQAQNLE